MSDQATARREPVVRVRDAQLLFVDYDAIRDDFPYLAERGLDCGSNAIHHGIVDEWLLDRASVMARHYARGTGVNGPFPYDDLGRFGYRPVGYGRALLIDTEDGLIAARDEPDYSSFLDVKGCGAASGRVPAAASHRNGLLLLHEAVGELVHQLITHCVLQHANLPVSTLPLYALISLGFRGRGPGGRSQLASLLVRRARPREPDPLVAGPGQRELRHLQMLVELTLRHYGMTTVAPGTQVRLWRDGETLQHSYGGTSLTFGTQAVLQSIAAACSLAEGVCVTLDIPNVQFTRAALGETPNMVDFGALEFSNEFSNPLLSFESEDDELFVRIFDQSSPRWVQPVQSISVDIAQLKRTDLTERTRAFLSSAKHTHGMRGAVQLGVRLASRVEAGTIDRSQFAAEVMEFVSNAVRGLRCRCRGSGKSFPGGN